MQEYPYAIDITRGEAADKFVDYVVLAEFDIDTGSTVRHQYPHNIPSYKADWFAEFMLPEGAHNRDSDYTYIFLNRDANSIDHEFWIRPPHYNPTIATSHTAPADSETKFLYGINLVKTKHDSSVRRGAIVKAMCIFSRYHYLEAFKKPLDLAIEKYFANPSVTVLETLFNALNTMDLSLLKRPNIMQQCLMRRGVCYENSDNNQTAYIPQSWTATVQFSCQTDSSVSDSGNDESIPLSIPLYRTPDEVGDISVTALVRTFGEATMRIFHAILMKQRVLFVGYNHAAGDVAQMVFSAVAMVAPPLTNIIKRTYPYANLSDLSFLEVQCLSLVVYSNLFGCECALR